MYSRRMYKLKRLAAYFLCAVLVSAAPQAWGAAPISASAAAAVQAPAELPDVISSVAPSVVGIMGKLSKTSRDYYEASDNLILGSGIIYKSNGYIITNQHVVEDCESLFVILSSKKVYEAKVVGVDEDTDLALIKINKGMLKPVEFADSAQVAIGAPVAMMGMPVIFDLHNSAGFGIVSGINRGNTNLTDYYFIQTDLVSNPGNSGGPLVDMDGKVLGIVEGGYVSYQGITFCIPSQIISFVAPQLLRYGRVRRPDLGASLAQSLSADYGLHTSEGLYFTDIVAGGPVSSVGVAEGDALLSINGVDVFTYTGYVEEMLKYEPGDTVDMLLLRDGGRRAVRIVLAEKE